MCGRFTQISSWQEVWQFMQPVELSPPQRPLAPSHNLAPSQAALVLAATEGSGLRALTPTWGLLPSWARDSRLPRPINARLETIASKPYFRDAYRHSRCIVPVDGWYEWKPGAAGKQPWYLSAAAGGLSLLAGLLERWHPGREDEVCSFAILTTTANAVAARVHERMPVVLDRAQALAWLGRGSKGADTKPPLLGPCPEHWLRTWPVSTRVNTPRNNDAGLIEPVPELA